MKLRVLGSAAGGGFPQWNCNCAQCDGYRRGTIQAKARTQSSIIVSDLGEDWVLFNTSPDILTQIQQNAPMQPGRNVRDTGIKSIVLMDAQIDHTTGLLMLREHKSPLNIWCTEPVREDLSKGNPLFGVLEHYCGTQWNNLIPGKTGTRIPGADNISMQALALTSNAPPYSPHRDKPVEGDTIGMLMTDTTSGEKLFYAPGLGEMEPHVWEAMQSADVILVDGTLWTDNEMIDSGLSKKTARSMGHMPQSGADGMIEWLDKLPATTRKVLIHINNSNPILDENSEQRATLTAHNIEVSFDGMEIEI